MVTGEGGWGVPGSGAAVTTNEREILWGGASKDLSIWKGAKISGTTRDLGNTPTTVLRPGLVMGVLTSSSEYEDFDGDAVDGTQNVAGVLGNEMRATDFDAVNTDRVFRILVRGLVKASKLLIEGSAFDGHLHEYLARRQMVAVGFVFDDDPFGYKAGTPRDIYKSASYVVVGDDNGATFVTDATATFTLPTIAPGLEFTFQQISDNNLVAASAEGDNMVLIDDASADSVTFITANQKIGAKVKIRSAYVNGTLKWLVELEPGYTATAAT